MNKCAIKKLRDKMIQDIWMQRKSEWEMKDLTVFFNLSLPQIYRILVKETKKAETKNK